MRTAWLLLTVVLLQACSSAPENERPSPLPAYSKEAEVSAAWSRRLGAWQAKPDGHVRPAVVNGLLIVVDGLNWLHAYDVVTGKLRWENRTKVEITGGIGVADDVLLVGTGHGEVLAYAASNGALMWKTSVTSEVLAPPTAADGIVVVRSGDGKLFALSTKDGRQLWMVERTVPSLILRGTGAAVIADGRVYAGFANGKLVVLNLRDGNPVWEATIASPQGRSELERMVDVDAEPIVRGDTVYAAAYQGRVVALGDENGRVLWSRELSVYNDMATDGHALYLTDDKGAVWAFDLASGAALWKQENLRYRMLSAPVLFGDDLVVADYQGYLHFLSPGDGRLVGRYHVDDKGIVGAPLASGKRLYVQGYGGGVRALRYK